MASRALAALGGTLLVACSAQDPQSSSASGDDGGGDASGADGGGPLGMPEAGGNEAGRSDASGGDGGGRGMSAGCGNGASGTTTKTVTIAGTVRTYDVLALPAYDKSAPQPLIFVFHHCGGDIAAAKGYHIQNTAQAAGAGAIFVFPQGLRTSAYCSNGGPGWNSDFNGYDVQLFDSMYDDVTKNFCVDTTRVFAMGFSGGADFTSSIGCYRGDEIRGVSPAAGGFYVQPSHCVGQPAFRLNAYVGASNGGDGAYSLMELDANVEFHRARNGCSTTTDPTTPSACVRFRNCSAPVDKCFRTGEPFHHWPTQADPDTWGRESWAFFASL